MGRWQEGNCSRLKRIECAGDIDLNILNENKEKEVTVKKVEYDHNLCANLLALSSLCEANN